MQEKDNEKKPTQESSVAKKKTTAAKKPTAVASAAKKTATGTTAKSGASARKSSSGTTVKANTAKPAAAKSTAKSGAVKKPTAKKDSVKAEAEENENVAVAAATENTVKTENAEPVNEVKQEPVAQAEEAQAVAEYAQPEVARTEEVAQSEIAVAHSEDTESENKADESAESGKTTDEQLAEQIAAGDFSHFDDEAEQAKEQSARDEKTEADKLLPPDPQAILEVRHLKKYFVLKKTITGKPLSTLKAVDDVSFKIMPGETLGIVGESGCGKTTMGRTVLKLHQPTSGQVFFEGADIAGYKSKQMRPLRTKMQIVFQDPYSSLPPRSTVGGILAEAVKVHKIVPKDQIKDYVLDVMDKCGLRDYYYERYPHEFSGGQRQRICIARALVLNPKLVVCDEPVSALDVSIQAQIINLLKKLQQERGLTYLFISHDLSVVKYISDKIGVMYLGSMVEFGDKDKIFNNPMHPYTVALFSAVPNPNPDEKTERIILKGDIPSPANPPKGCKFHTRCSKCMEICKHVAPVYKEYEEGHFVACHCYSQED